MTAVTMKGEPLELTGNAIKVGAPAPGFEVTDGELNPASAAEIVKGVTLVISVPSLDTSVCSKETRRLSGELAKLEDDFDLNPILISMDLPFAQQRWLKEAGIDNIRAFSDYRLADYGRAYGVLIEKLRLLARTVWIIDGSGTIRYRQIVEEVTDEPDYDEVLEAIKDV